MAIDVSTLRRLKNQIIGSPSSKEALAQDAELLKNLIECLNDAGSSTGEPRDPNQLAALRIEAALVLASLAQGAPAAVGTLLRYRTHHALLYALSHLTPSDPPLLQSSIARALRTLATSLADIAGPSQWGLLPESLSHKDEAKQALDYLFEVSTLDIYLPLLISSSQPVRIAIASTLGATMRIPPYRTAVTEWLPPSDRAKEAKGKRGWEKPSVHNTDAPSRSGGWVARCLVGWLKSPDVKAQEAALWALSSLSQDNHAVAPLLAKVDSSRNSCLLTTLSLCRSKSIEVKLAASLCAAHIIRSDVHPPSSSHTSTTTHVPVIVNTAVRILTSSAESLPHRTKAAYILYHLVTDDRFLCHLAYEHGALDKLCGVVVSITPAISTQPEGWDESESAEVGALRESCITALAALAMQDQVARGAILEVPGMPDALHASLRHQCHVGTRYAACQCVRALGRGVAVIRTGLFDSGLGLAALNMVLHTRPDEDWRVLSAVSAAVCNLVTDFSPLREVLLKGEALARLVQLLHSEHPPVRLNILWAIKNLLWKSTSEVKRSVMDHIGWHTLLGFLSADADQRMQEQAFAVLRNIADREEDVVMVFEMIGNDVLLDELSAALDSDSDDVQTQAVGLLANLSNGLPEHHSYILGHARIMHSLRSCLTDLRVEVRRPAVSCVLQLVRSCSTPERASELKALGLESTLRHLCEGPEVSTSPLRSPRIGRFASMGMEVDREVREKARDALHYLEHEVTELTLI